MAAAVMEQPKAEQPKAKTPASTRVLFYCCVSPNYVIGNIEPEETAMQQLENGRFRKAVLKRGKCAAFTNFRIEVPPQYVEAMQKVHRYGYDFISAKELRELLVAHREGRARRDPNVEMRGRIFLDNMIRNSKRALGETDSLKEADVLHELEVYGQ